MSRILVVDDEPHIRELISAILQTEGHEVETASNGRIALEKVNASIPDMIVLDLAMPEMDGWHVLEELHRTGIRRRTRVVIVSGNLDDAAMTRGQRSSVRHLLAKPFEVEALLTLVRDALAQPAEELFERRERTDSLARLIERVDKVLS